MNLILADGATLSADKGIAVTSDDTTVHKLNIYAQSAGTGRLNADGATTDRAGIGGGQNKAGGTVTIHSGTVTASGGTNRAGIGGGQNGAGGTVTIYDGTVTASGGSNAQGIGRGSGNAASGALIVGKGIKVLGGSSANPTTEITDYSTNRPQYMKVFTPPVSYVELSFDVATGKVSSDKKTVTPYTVLDTSTLTTWSSGWYAVSGDVRSRAVSPSTER